MEGCEECLEIGGMLRIEGTRNSELTQDVESELENEAKNELEKELQNEWGKEVQNEWWNEVKQLHARGNLWLQQISADSQPCIREQTLTFTDNGSQFCRVRRTL